MSTLTMLLLRTRMEVLNMSPRPKSDKSKNLRFEIRMTKETAEKIEYCAQKMDTSKTNVILHGVDLVKKELDKE